MRNFMLTLCYDGTRYNGWQKQGNTENTIQHKLETLLSRLLSQEVEIAASGRTDAGVHARRQVCSFKAETELDCETLLADIRKYLPEDIGAISLSEAGPRFHARLNCKGKTYVYRVRISEVPDVFGRKYVYKYNKPLDIAAMRSAAEKLCGEHDFSAFTSAKRMKKSAVRCISAIDISEENGEVRFSLTGNGFLYNMVRIIVGTLLEVGAGERDTESVESALSSRDRKNAGFTAPAQGLILWDVFY